MRRAYCADGAHPETSPCKLDAFLKSVKAADAEKRKQLMEERK